MGALLKHKRKRTKGIAQVVECLLSQNKALSSIPNAAKLQIKIQKKVLSMVVHTRNFSTREAEAMTIHSSSLGYIHISNLGT
jgi:hypothetical protein